MPTNRCKTVRTDWKKLQASGGLTHEQQFRMTALLRDVDGKPPLTSAQKWNRTEPSR